MFNKRNPMKYFSGSAFARLPLYKLVAGASATVLTASIGLGVFAASFTPGAEPEPTPTPTPVATPESTPTPTPEPDKELLADVSVVQQDVGVQLYTLLEEAPSTPEYMAFWFASGLSQSIFATVPFQVCPSSTRECTRNGSPEKKEGFYQYSAAWDSKHRVTLAEGKTARVLFELQEMQDERSP